MLEQFLAEISESTPIKVAATVFLMMLWQLAGWLTGRIRTPIDLIASLTNSGVVQTYRNFQNAARDIERHMASTSEVRFLSLRGFPVTQETYALHESLRNNLAKLNTCPIKIMILDPDGLEARERAEIYSRMAPEGPENYIKQIRESVNMIKDIGRDFRNFSFRVYDQAGAFRILILDNAAFVGFYSQNIRGATSIVLRLKRGSTLYGVFCYYYERVWAHGTEA
jgi:hypothetical protein